MPPNPEEKAAKSPSCMAAQRVRNPEHELPGEFSSATTEEKWPGYASLQGVNATQ